MKKHVTFGGNCDYRKAWLSFVCGAIILKCVSVTVFVIRTRLSQNFVGALLEFIISLGQFPDQLSNYRLLFPNNDFW